MKVLYDYQIFERQKFGGISRYFFELLNHFGEDNNLEWELPVAYSDNEYLKNVDRFRGKLISPGQRRDPYKAFLYGMHFSGKHILYGIKNKIFPNAQNAQPEDNKTSTIRKLKEGNFDVFHPTYYDDYFLEHIGDKPFVITVYDLIHQIFPEFLLYDKPDKTAAMLNRAKKIMAISESTKKDLINIFNIDADKITVTLLANSLNPNSTAVSAMFENKTPAKFILFVGNRDGYKNFLFFVQVFAALAKIEDDLYVVCTGPSFNEKELLLFDQAGITERVQHTFVTDNELSFLYKKAKAFIFPSMYEGFGLPILEAFGCGCPVLVSNTSSMAEIGSDAVIYFEPKDGRSMIDAIKSVLHDRDLVTDKIGKGYQQLQKFSWEQTARRTFEVYKEALLS